MIGDTVVWVNLIFGLTRRLPLASISSMSVGICVVYALEFVTVLVLVDE